MKEMFQENTSILLIIRTLLKILTCFTPVQLYTQRDSNMPVLRNDSYGPCGNWWNQVIFDNTVFIVVG